MGEDREPPDPIGEVTVAAVELHEAYLSLREAGFDERAALYLTASIVAHSPGPAPPGADDGNKGR